MDPKVYSIARKAGGKWVICAHGQEILLCSSRSVAARAIKEDIKLLKQAGLEMQLNVP
jgi:hypothetical protein